jgi:hypothetical protein
MTARLKDSVEISGRNRRNMDSTGSLFQLQDVVALENTAGRPFPCWQDPDNARRELRFDLRRQLHGAFLDAHIYAEDVRTAPPPSEIRDAFDKAARAGREFLGSLGIELSEDEDIAGLAGLNDTEIGTSSGVVRELIERVEVEASRLCSAEIRGLLSGLKFAINETNIAPVPEQLVNNWRILEAVRSVAYVVAGAEDAITRMAEERRKSGPSKDVFGPALMQGLLTCYELMFSEAPTLARKDDTWEGVKVFDPQSPPLLWVKLALRQAFSSLTGPRPELMAPPSVTIIEVGTGGTEPDFAIPEIDAVAAGSDFASPAARRLSAPPAVCRFAGSDRLAAAISALLSLDEQSLAKLFHQAIRRTEKSRRAS